MKTTRDDGGAHMDITGAIFDCDGTLVDSMPMWHEVTLDVLRGHVDDPERVFRESESGAADEMCRTFHEEYGVGESAEAVFDDLMARVTHAYQHEVEPVPGALDFVRQLAEAGIPMVVASSTTPPEVRVALRAQGIEDLFVDVVGTCDVSRSKDFPDVYLHAAKVLGTDVATTWVFEDGPFGLRAARLAGFPTAAVWLPDRGRDAEECRRFADIFSHGFTDLSLPIIRDYERPVAGTDGVMRALVVDGSPEPSGPELVRDLAGEADFVVAVDRGADACLAAGVRPDVMAGDADSASGEALSWARTAAREVRYPSDKYATDLAIAIGCVRHEAARRGARARLLLTCAGGGRPDHALAVAGLLAQAADLAPRQVEDGFELRVLSGEGQEAWRLGEGEVGRTLSVVPLSEGCVVSERGMRWDLDHRELPLLGDEGVSNVVERPGACVECHAGRAAVVLVG